MVKPHSTNITPRKKIRPRKAVSSRLRVKVLRSSLAMATSARFMKKLLSSRAVMVRGDQVGRVICGRSRERAAPQEEARHQQPAKDEQLRQEEEPESQAVGARLPLIGVVQSVSACCH